MRQPIIPVVFRRADVGPLSTTVLALVLVAMAYAAEHHIGLDLADEGYLWYGAWRVTLGEVPIRDFQSYDPARYYWAALWLRFLGNDIGVLRLSVASLHAVVMAIGLRVLARVIRQPLALAAAGALMVVWLFPRHKAFEPLVAVAGIYVGILLLESPTRLRTFLAGVFVGFAAFVGRNHGVYMAVTFVLLLLWLSRAGEVRSTTRYLVVWCAGIVLGYAPMLAMMVVVPSFMSAFMDSFFSHVRTVSLPIFWAWSGFPEKLRTLVGIRETALGCLHVVAVFAYAVLAVHTIKRVYARQEVQPVVMAATVIGIAYLHVMFLRAGLGHFAQAVIPLILGGIAFVATACPGRHIVLRFAAVTLFTALSVASVGIARPAGSYLLAARSFERAEVGQRELLVPSGIGSVIAAANTLRREIGADDGVFVAPNLPGFYVLLGKRSLAWETYILFRASQERENALIERLKASNSRWAILNDLSSTPRSEFGLQSTYPLVWKFVHLSYERVDVANAPSDLLVFRRRSM